VFSSGHNFMDMIDNNNNAEKKIKELFIACTNMMNLIQSIPQPVIAKVAGLATAAGCQLVATCDLAIAAESASFALPGGKGGLFCHTPLVSVARNVGRKRALELAMTGDAISAHTAADWGLINRVVPDHELDYAVLDLITRATRGSTYSKALGKQSFYKQIDMPQPYSYNYAINVMTNAACTADAQEAFNAFFAKRQPNYDRK
jgi:enoyl-CoA hydratase/carnithine racemase